MNLLALLVLILPITALADVMIGGGYVLSRSWYGGALHHQGTILEAEFSKGKYTIAGVLMKRPHPDINYQPLIKIQRKFGSRAYIKPGIGLTRATQWNTVLNFCGSVGIQISNGALEWTHCSNGGTGRPNRGIDFIAIKWRLKND